jgi:hypothetical protein
MPSKFCLDCKDLFKVMPDGSASRCPACQAGLDARLNARPKANTTARGLGHAHRVRAKAVVAAAQCCQRCGCPPTPGNPLTAHHTRARSKGGQDSPLIALCRSCNSKIGNRT